MKKYVGILFILSILFSISTLAMENFPTLHKHVISGDIKAVREVIDSGCDVNEKCNSVAPLHIAALNDHWEIIELLKEFGADVNVKDDYKGGTPLHCAAAQEKEKSMRTLVKLGANINITDNEGKTPSHYVFDTTDDCYKRNNDKVIAVLYDLGANINITDNEGKTPLDYASGSDKDLWESIRLVNK